MSNELPPFTELHTVSNFSFLRGASHPEELVTYANDLGYSALALTDECSVAGVVRAHVTAKNHNFKLIIGSEFLLQDGLRLTLYATNRKTYGDLSQLITRGRRAAEKGGYHLTRLDISELAVNCLALWLPERDANIDQALWLADTFTGNAWIAVELMRQGDDRIRLQQLTGIGKQIGLPLVAANDIHAHKRQRRPLQDTLAAIRCAQRLKPRAIICMPMVNAISAVEKYWPGFIRKSCLPRQWLLLNAAGLIWMSCATNIRRSWYPAARHPTTTSDA